MFRQWRVKRSQEASTKTESPETTGEKETKEEKTMGREESTTVKDVSIMETDLLAITDLIDPTKTSPSTKLREMMRTPTLTHRLMSQSETSRETRSESSKMMDSPLLGSQSQKLEIRSNGTTILMERRVTHKERRAIKSKIRPLRNDTV